MKFVATLTVEMPMSAAAHSARDEYCAPFSKLDGVNVDVFSIPALLDELEASRPKMESYLVAKAKKFGLTLKGAPDVSYGLHGGNVGTVTMWAQVRGEAR